METNYKVTVKSYTIKVADEGAMALNSPSTVHSCLSADYDVLSEDVYLLLLNAKNRVIDKVLIAKGAVNAVAVDPKSIFRHVLLSNSDRFIIAHNHPSGDTSPSEEDFLFTKKVIDASKLMGMNFLDHIIYSETAYTSLREQGVIC